MCTNTAAFKFKKTFPTKQEHFLLGDHLGSKSTLFCPLVLILLPLSHPPDIQPEPEKVIHLELALAAI